jgi:hypothetical protein
MVFSTSWQLSGWSGTSLSVQQGNGIVLARAASGQTSMTSCAFSWMSSGFLSQRSISFYGQVRWVFSAKRHRFSLLNLKYAGHQQIVLCGLGCTGRDATDLPRPLSWDTMKHARVWSARTDPQGRQYTALVGFTEIPYSQVVRLITWSAW